MKKKIQFYQTRFISSLKDMLESSCNLYGSKTACLVKKGKGEPYTEISFRELKRDVDALGSSLMELGLQGSNIAIIGENSYEWLVSYLAVINGVGVVVPLDKELPLDEQLNLIKRSEVAAIIYDPSFSSNYEPTSIPFKINMHPKELRDDELSLFHLIEKGNGLLNHGYTDYLNRQIDPEKMAAILFTSGTTDLAKGVVLSHKNICSVIMSTCRIVEIHESDRTLSILPIHHTFECTLGILLPLYKGASIAFCEGLKYIAANIVEAEATVLIGVPLILESIHSKIWKQAQKVGKEKSLKTGIKISNLMRKAHMDLSRKIFKDIHKKFGGKLRLVVTGAAAINPAVIRDFENFGIKVVQGYGLTECAPLVTGTPDTARKVGSVGIAVPTVEVELFEPNEDGIGEIICKGPNIMLGYYKDELNTEKVLKNGWFYTGDLGYKDEEGFYYIAGRKKNVIVTKNGKNIYPEEVEFYLNMHDIIEESLVTGITNAKTGETLVSAQLKPALDIIYEKFGNLAEKDLYELFRNLIHDLNDKLPLYKRIRDFSIRKEDFIRTTTKKIKRHMNHV